MIITINTKRIDTAVCADCKSISHYNFLRISSSVEIVHFNKDYTEESNYFPN